MSLIYLSKNVIIMEGLMKSVKIIAIVGLIVGQSLVAQEYTPCQLANQNILKVMEDIQNKDQEFQHASAEISKAREVLGASQLAKDYNNLIASYRRPGVSDKLSGLLDRQKLGMGAMPKEITSNDIYVKYRAELSKLDSQWDAVKKGLDQRTKQNPAYKEAVQHADYECSQPSSGFTPCQIAMHNSRKVADEITEKGEDYNQNPAYQAAKLREQQECSSNK
jgi:hypothetical protein